METGEDGKAVSRSSSPPTRVRNGLQSGVAVRAAKLGAPARPLLEAVAVPRLSGGVDGREAVGRAGPFNRNAWSHRPGGTQRPQAHSDLGAGVGTDAGSPTGKPPGYITSRPSRSPRRWSSGSDGGDRRALGAAGVHPLLQLTPTASLLDLRPPEGPVEAPADGEVIHRQVLGGRVHDYYRQAA